MISTIFLATSVTKKLDHNNHYSGKPIKEKVALAKCIETVLERVAITTTGEEPATYLPEPVTYTRPEPKLSRVAETSIPYGTENE